MADFNINSRKFGARVVVRGGLAEMAARLLANRTTHQQKIEDHFGK